MPDETPGDVHSKEELYRGLIEREGAVSRLRNACDAWTAAFFAPRGSGQERIAPTTAGIWNALAGCENPQRAALIDELSDRSHFFHWRLEFPEVFERGGFDVMLGNPPWDVSQLVEEQYFSTSAPDIAKLKGEARGAAIAALAETNVELWSKYRNDLRDVEAVNNFAKLSGKCSLTTHGKINFYALFVKLDSYLMNGVGRTGIVVQSGIATDDSNKLFFQAITNGRRLASLYDFENRRAIFDIDSRYKFCLMTLSHTVSDPDYAFFLLKVRELAEPLRHFKLPAVDISHINPNTKTMPIFRSMADAQVTRSIYDKTPILIEEDREGKRAQLLRSGSNIKFPFHLGSAYSTPV
jgi:hypothetical protein